MAAAAILNSPIRKFLLADGIRRTHTHHCTNFHQNRSLHCGDIAIFKNFKMASAVILDFCNGEILRWKGSRHICLPNFVKIGQSVAKILRFLDFSRWRPPPSWIFKFVTFYWLTVSRAQTHNCTKFRQNRSFRCGDMRFFGFSRCPPPPSWIFKIAKIYWLLGSRGSRRICVPNVIKIGLSVAKILRIFDYLDGGHLGFVCGIFGPPGVSTCGSLSHCKIWLCSMQ